MSKGNGYLAKIRRIGVVRSLIQFPRLTFRRIFRKELVFVSSGGQCVKEVNEPLNFEVISKHSKRKEFIDLGLSQKAKERIENDETLVCLMRNGKIAAYGWGREQSSLHFSYVSNGIDLKRKIFYIYDCFTYPDFRGNGFYSHVLIKFWEIASRDEVYVACQSHNTGSIRGILKAGFRPFKEFVLVELYFFRFKFVLSSRKG